MTMKTSKTNRPTLSINPIKRGLCDCGSQLCPCGPILADHTVNETTIHLHGGGDSLRYWDPFFSHRWDSEPSAARLAHAGRTHGWDTECVMSVPSPAWQTRLRLTLFLDHGLAT
jgi:hypothetical protein